jgi:hypothetical protein
MQDRFVFVLGLALLFSHSACALAREAPEAATSSTPGEAAEASQANPGSMGRKRIIESTLTVDASVPRRARLALEQ